MSTIMLEMDRMLRPGGRVYIRDSISVMGELQEIATAMGWVAVLHETGEGPHASWKILISEKRMWCACLMNIRKTMSLHTFWKYIKITHRNKLQLVPNNTSIIYCITIFGRTLEDFIFLCCIPSVIVHYKVCHFTTYWSCRCNLHVLLILFRKLFHASVEGICDFIMPGTFRECVTKETTILPIVFVG